MVQVFVDTPQQFPLNEYLKNNLDQAKKITSKDWDMVFLVDGYEGSGKSVLAMQVAYYCDPSLVAERICFTSQDFQEAIKKADKYQAIVYDEAYTGLSSRGTMSKVNKSIVEMLAEIRQKNLFVVIVMPTFFDLDKYVALWRSRVLLHVYTGANFQRGFFSFYNADNKKALYVQGKKFYNYHAWKPNFRAKFGNYYPIDEAEYREKKRTALGTKNTEPVGHEARYKKRIEETIVRMKEMGYKNVELCKFFDYDATRICQIAGK